MEKQAPSKTIEPLDDNRIEGSRKGSGRWSLERDGSASTGRRRRQNRKAMRSNRGGTVLDNEGLELLDSWGSETGSFQKSQACRRLGTERVSWTNAGAKGGGVRLIDSGGTIDEIIGSRGLRLDEGFFVSFFRTPPPFHERC